MDRNVVTDENVDDMIDAGQYGIAYWAREMSPEDKAKAPEHAVCMFVEADDYGNDGGLHYLTREQIRDAYCKLLDLDQRYVNSTIHGYFIDSYRNRDENGIDAGSIDSDAGDVLLQVAAFDEVIYG